MFFKYFWAFLPSDFSEFYLFIYLFFCDYVCTMLEKNLEYAWMHLVL